ncbi:MAG: hypothetical protein ACRDDY_03925 [Clostridium sp.]|uniref:hypothetical protein n=1 Tax=Clostridium sp. TaxID=1506 RepID=UPI003EE63A71
MPNVLGERNEQFVGRTGGEIVVSAPAKNLTKKKIVLLANLITTREPASYSMNNMSTGMYDKVTANTNSGKIAGQVTTNEQEPAGDISFGFQEDYIYIGDALGQGSKSKLLALFNGEGFYNGEDSLVPVGTNGTVKETSDIARPHEVKQPWMYLYYNEGAFIKQAGATDSITGEPLLKRNPFSDSLNREYKTLCAEFLSVAGSGTSVNRMFAILGKSALDYTEGDINSFSLTMTRGCDLSERKGYFWETVEGAPKNDASKLREFEVDSICIGAEPTGGVTGNIACVVSADGTITFKKKTASAWEAENTLTTKIQTGTRILARKIDVTAKASTVGNVFVVVGADGKAVDFSLDAGKKQHYIEVMLFNRDSGEYETYVTPDAIPVGRPKLL